MNGFHSTPVTHQELIRWKVDPSRNPRTGRKISEQGDIFSYLKKEYDKQFPEIRKNLGKKKKKKIVKVVPDQKLDTKKEEFKIEDSVDDKDPISLTVFWIEENGTKKIVYSDISKLQMYKDSRGLIRCFEKDTLEYLKAHNITKHPVTLDDIPKEILDVIVAKNLEEERKEKTVNDKAFEIFQKFANISIFIDSEWFLDLTKEKLVKFNYEISDMYRQNFSKDQMKEIHSKPLFNQDNHILEKKEINEIQEYLLEQMNYILDVKKEELKYMCNYLLVGSLSVVIPQIRDLYPDFCFSFTF